MKVVRVKYKVPEEDQEPVPNYIKYADYHNKRTKYFATRKPRERKTASFNTVGGGGGSRFSSSSVRAKIISKSRQGLLRGSGSRRGRARW